MKQISRILLYKSKSHFTQRPRKSIVLPGYFQKNIRFLISVLCVIAVTTVSGCLVEPPFAPDFPVGQVEGYKPLYISPDQTSIVFESSRSLRSPGKIYSIANYLLINEKYEGIHVFDNSNPASPVALGFLSIAGNTEVAVRNNILYADHLTDLVALNVDDWNNIREVSRIKKEFLAQRLPPMNGRYFECIDEAKGVVVGWEMATLKNPKCFR